MRFLSPFALVGLALIALPVAIHLLVRRRGLRMDFPSLAFLRETPSFRLHPRRIQQPLLLALRIAAILLLVLGLARPLITFFSNKERTRVILLDASLSMRANGRVDAMKEIARRVVNDLADGERVAIVAFSSDSNLLSPLTTDKRVLSDAIDRFQPGNAGANYAEAFKSANASLQGESLTELSVDIISDFQESNLPRQSVAELTNGLLGRTKVYTHPVGEPLARNAFIVSEEVFSGESAYEISGYEQVLTNNERQGNRRSWILDTRDGTRMGLEWRTESNGQVTARIATVAPDDFDADDERFLVFTPPRKGRALLIEHESDDAAPYLRAAIEATATDLGENRFAVEHKSALPSSPSELETYSLVILTLHGAPRSDDLQTLASYARSGGTVWLCVANDLDTGQWNQFANTEAGRVFPFARIERKTDANQASGFGSIDSDAPVLRFLNDHIITTLQSVRMREGFAVTPRDGAATLMRWNDATPALVSMEIGKGNLMLLATSPARAAGELGASPAFPALASSIARFGIAPREPLAREIGQPVNLRLAPQTQVTIIDSKGRSATTHAGELLLQPTIFFPSPGIYQLRSDNVTTYLALNTPESESSISLAPASALNERFKAENAAATHTTTAWRDAAERSGNAWKYLLVLAFALLLAELFLTMKQIGKTRIKAK